MKSVSDQQPPNPLIPAILDLLNRSGKTLKIYQILSDLDADIAAPLVATDDYHLAIFRKNYWLMNALFRLQSALLEQGYFLKIGQVEVSLLVASPSAGAEISDDSDGPLREFYLDWAHYHEAGVDEVISLLKSFWSHYDSSDNVKSALHVFGLEYSQDYDWELIKIRYRKLASQYHPDRGGDAAQFITLREAYEILDLHFNARS